MLLIGRSIQRRVRRKNICESGSGLATPQSIRNGIPARLGSLTAPNQEFLVYSDSPTSMENRPDFRRPATAFIFALGEA